MRSSIGDLIFSDEGHNIHVVTPVSIGGNDHVHVTSDVFRKLTEVEKEGFLAEVKAALKL